MTPDTGHVAPRPFEQQEQVAQLASVGLDVVPGSGAGAPPPTRSPRLVRDDPSTADRTFNIVTMAAGILVLVLLTLGGFFLVVQISHAISVTGPWQFLSRTEFRTDVSPPRVGVLGLLMGTVLVALTAISFAVPLGVLAALAITEYAGAKARKW